MDEGFNAVEESVESAGADDWGDIDVSDVSQDVNLESEVEQESAEEHSEPQTAEGADQPTETVVDKAQDTAEKTVPIAEQAKADQPYVLKHLGEVKEVSRDEVVTLAQKGLNYDHIRTERDEARAKREEYEAFLKEIADPQHLSIDDLMDSTRAKVLARRENIDESVALGRIKNERDRKAIEAERNKQLSTEKEKAEAEQKRQEGFVAFAKAHPDVDVKSIPQPVWDAVRGGQTLLEAYSSHEQQIIKAENAELKRKLEAFEQNAKNKERSTGSKSSAGSKQTKDKFFDGWDE